MKKPLILLFSTSLLFSLTSCNEPFSWAPVDNEIEASYKYFMYTTNLTEGSNAYGLTRDRMTQSGYSSIAATGFLLGSYPVFVEQGLMTKDDAKNIVDKTFDTILRMQADTTTSYCGCLSHFVDMTNAKNHNRCEISTIDTAILVSGCITASQYFEDEAIIEKANTIWGNVDYNQFSVTRGSKEYISMGVDADRNQLSPWDTYAEQLMIYILGAGNPNSAHRLHKKYYDNFSRKVGAYDGVSHIYSWFGSLFTYQYSQAFYNFRNYVDEKGTNWFENSVNASITAYKYSKSLAKSYKTFNSPAWGLTACDTPLGYSGLLGSSPRGYSTSEKKYFDILGTCAPTAAISSMPFTPNESMSALKYFQTLKVNQAGGFGLYDSYNLDFYGAEWVCTDIIGIDKGCAVMQMYNYKNPDFVSNLAMKNPYVVEGFVRNGLVETATNE